MNLSQIKSDALAATQGKWSFQVYGMDASESIFAGEYDDLLIASTSIFGKSKQQREANARHIANMDPPTTIALVEEVERLREENARLNAIAPPNFIWTGGEDQMDDPEWIIQMIKDQEVVFHNSGTPDVCMEITTNEDGRTEIVHQGDTVFKFHYEGNEVVGVLRSSFPVGEDQ